MSDNASASPQVPANPQARALPGSGLRVALFATCLVDTLRPTIGFAAAKLLEQAGCTVEVPKQTCCGQPAYNSGDRQNARALALQMVEAFAPFDYIVVPSGSCGGMVRKHYPQLVADDPELARRVQAVSDKTHELVSFLVDVLKISHIDTRFEGRVTYHDSCSGLRELGIAAQPRALLARIAGLDLVEMKDHDVCCGFGGTFAVKYDDISNQIVQEKVAHIQQTAADTLLAGDLGCLLNMAGKLSRQGANIRVRHIAEVLAGMADGPAIGEPAAPSPPEGGRS